MEALIAMGATFCAGSVFVLVRRAILIKGAIQASGVVIRIETEYEVRPVGGFDRILIPRYVPVIHFGTSDDPDVVARLPATSSGQYCFGQRVSFLHDPRHPQYVMTSYSEHRECLRESRTHTTCFWKGRASYYDVEVSGKVNRDAAWYYPEPSRAAQEIKDYVAFWGGVRVVE